MYKKIAVALILGLLLFQGAGVEAVDIGGEFELGSSYDLDRDDSARVLADLEVSIGRSTFSEAFQVNLGFMTDWPDGETGFEIREAYFDYYGADFDLRAGKQLVTWGTAIGYNPTDNINPINLDDPAGDKDSRLLLKGDYFIDRNYRLTGLIAPFHESPFVGEIEMPGMERTIPINEVADDFENLEYGLKFSGRGVGGFDFSVSLFSGHEQMPTIFYQESMQGPVPESAFFREYLVLGADMATSYQGFGLWVEGALMMPDAGDNYGSLVLGADYKLESGQLLLGQLIYNQDRLNQESNYILQQAVEGSFAGYHSYRLAAFYNLSTDGYLVRPELEFSLADALSLEFEYIYQNGEVMSMGMESVSQDRNQLSAAISYSF
ncbi:MAG: hypothetical protein ABR596_08200 [Halarsenatibacteraceae bacterium]